MLLLAQKHHGDVRLVSCEEKMERTLEYGFEGKRNAPYGPGNADAPPVARLGG